MAVRRVTVPVCHTFHLLTLAFPPDSTGHSLIYSHALAVDLYRREFAPHQGGRIGVTLNCDWAEPIDDSDKARKAAQRRLDSALGWWADPICE
jgi:beta-glucosidase